MEKVTFQHPELDGTTFFWEAGETAILCLHGFTATTTEIRPVARYFNNLGFSAGGPLLPGHGTTPEDLNRKNYNDWTTCAESMFTEIRETHRSIFVLGESMGALLALHLLASHQEIKGGMILAPALKLPRLWLAKLIWPFKKSLYKGGDGDNDMPWSGYNVVPLKAAASLYDFQKLVQKELRKVKQPVIIFHGKNDKRIKPESPSIVLETICSEQKELIVMQDSGHVILLDKQAELVFDLCGDFLSTVLDGNPQV